MGLNLNAFAQSASGKSKVAIYWTLGNGVDSDYKDFIAMYFIQAITNSKDYVVVERNDAFVSAMSQEGAYAQEDIIKVGKDFSADYVLVIDIKKMLGEYVVATRLIDVNVENGNIIKAYSANAIVNNINQLKVLSQDVVDGLLECSSSGGRASGGTAGNYNNHEYVDLGLPSGLKWATMNVGASSPSDYGEYFAWGETVQKYDFNENNCATMNRTMGEIGGNPQYDVARAKWGGSWRMPTRSEFEELLCYCTWVFTTMGSHNGYMVTGPNGKQIFFPAAGYRGGTMLSDADSYGNYWSSSPYDDAQFVYELLFSSSKHKVNWTRRRYGQSVRPVTE